MPTKLEEDVAALKKYAKSVAAWHKKLRKWAKQVNSKLSKLKHPTGGGGSNPPPPPNWPP